VVTLIKSPVGKVLRVLAKFFKRRAVVMRDFDPVHELEIQKSREIRGMFSAQHAKMFRGAEIPKVSQVFPAGFRVSISRTDD
jgi:hypothetical protein